ncbi:hypothetical protein GCM10027346_37340 [Hymenobacter seoulensis]
MLTKTQRNQLVELIQKMDIPINHLQEDRGASAYIIKVLGDISHFTVTINRNSINGEFSVDTIPYVASAGWADLGQTWQDVLKCFSIWAQQIRADIDAPDLWAEATKTAQLFGNVSEAANDKFTRGELAQVQGQLRQMKQNFATADLPEAAKQKLIDLTAEAAVKAEGLTKKDWQNWIIGGFVSAITGLMLNPTQAQEVLKLVKAAFGGLFLK